MDVSLTPSPDPQLIARAGGWSERRFREASFGDVVAMVTEFTEPVRFGSRLAHAYPWSSYELVLAGTGAEVYRGGERAWGPGVLFTYTSGSQHYTIRQRGPVRIVRLRMPEGGVTPRLEERLGPAERAHVSGLLYRLATTMITSDSASLLDAESLCAEIGSVTARSRERTEPAWVRGVEESVRASVDEPPTLVRLAEDAGMHRCHLARGFRQWRGCSVGEYLRRLRLGRALEQLASASTPLSLVAARAGFSDQSHFCREFKRVFGVTPSAYRRVALTPPVIAPIVRGTVRA